jgi:hypothetical protein
MHGEPVVFAFARRSSDVLAAVVAFLLTVASLT